MATNSGGGMQTGVFLPYSRK